MQLSRQQIDDFQNDGVVMIKGLFKDWVDIIQAGIERNMREPGPDYHEYVADDENGGFYGDYCNWQRIPEFVDAIENSDAGMVAAHLTNSKNIQVFHEHILVKEPGTAMPTPWHQDSPYYFIDGEQTVSLWSPLDPVKDATLRCVAGSHKWQKPVLPIKWLSEEGFFPGKDDYMPIPDPDTEPEKYKVLEWEMEPGDVVAFNFKILHGARGNNTAARRRAFSLRLIGDDARYITRPGPTSPPFTGHNMKDGERLREDWFPVIYSKNNNP